jgi:hypothetical protein
MIYLKKQISLKTFGFFESQMSGVMPIEVMVDTKDEENGATQLSTLNRVERLAAHIRSVPELSEPLSIAHIAKYAKPDLLQR